MAVPGNWCIVPLGDVLLKIIGGGTPSKQTKSYWNGSIPWLTIKDMRSRRPTDSIDHISEIAVKESSTNIIPADTVIIATRIGLGKVVRVAYDAAINQDLKALITPPNIDNGYLEYWIVSIASYLESIGSGTTVKGIRLEQVRSLPFPLAPIDQQKLIVAEIEKQFSRLDEAVANLKRVKANLKRYKAAVLKAAVEGKLTEEWRKQHPDVEPADKLLERILAERREKWQGRGKYKEPVAPDITDLPELPKGWVWATLEQICSFFVDSAHRTPKYSDSGFPALRPRDVVYGKLNLENAALVPESEFEIQSSRHIVNSGDIVYSRELSFGWGAEIPEGVKVCLSQGMCVFRPNEEISPKFFLYLLNGPTGRVQAEAAATGSAHPHINLGKIKAYTFPLSPTEERVEISRKLECILSVIENGERTITTALTRADRLRQSILKKAFSGKLTFNTGTATPQVRKSKAEK